MILALVHIIHNHSVLYISMRLYSFHLKIKSHWLGPTYKEEGVAGNDITRSNVPDIRIAFRHETFTEEINCIIGAVLAT